MNADGGCGRSGVSDRAYPSRMAAPIGGIERALDYPRLRWMGNKSRLLPWIHAELEALSFDSALDAFCGSGAVSYLLKSMGKRVLANDFMRFGATLAEALTVNPGLRLGEEIIDRIAAPDAGPRAAGFIETTFSGIFFDPEDLAFLDRARARIERLPGPRRALALAALGRAALKKQPRGVFTISGDLSRHDDGRRDLRLPLAQHFRESAALFDAMVFDDGLDHASRFGDVFDIDRRDFDLVYLDPPYVPRADDNCYVKRYHFVEGLMSGWQAPEARILPDSKVKKLEKRYSPFSYRKSALEAFDRLFATFRDSILVLSYSSNGWPDLEHLCDLMRAHKPEIEVKSHTHRYHFGNHPSVAGSRRLVDEYLIIGR